MTAVPVLLQADIEPEPGSELDPAGQLFRWKGRLFRSVRDPATWETYRHILDLPATRQGLVAAGLVETWIPEDVRLEASSGLLEHKMVDFVSSRPEWTLRMLWDAARCCVRCAAALAEERLVLKDCHPWNVLFDYCEPRLVDFGSIVPESHPSGWLNELRMYFILPLWLAKIGGSRGHTLARSLMLEHLRGLGTTVINSPRVRLLPYRFSVLSKRYHQALHSGNRARMARFFRDLQAYIDGFEPVAPKQLWAAYNQGEEEPSTGQKLKQDYVTDILRSLKLESLLDMGANRGWYAFSAEALGYRTVAFDFEEFNVDQIYLRGRAEKRRVLPLYMNLLHPSPESGIGLAFRNSFDRLRCDVSLVLGLVHHLALHQGVNFDIMARIVDRYTRSASILEFVTPEDAHIRTWAIPPDYTMDNFAGAMNRRGFFLDSQQVLIPGRHLLAFRRMASCGADRG